MHHRRGRAWNHATGLAVYSDAGKASSDAGDGECHFHPHDLDAGRLAYRHSSRNATPTPVRTNIQTQKTLTRYAVTPDSRNTQAETSNTGPLIAQ